jgi:hypothetical protein
VSTAGDRLYRLLPAAIRSGDAEVGFPLRALLDIIGEQADALAADIARGYENLFIETAEDWVVPYLADLTGAVPLYDASRSSDDQTALVQFTDLRGPRLLAPAGASARADVAKTIAMRRRKGTVSGLADVAAYASGFPVHLVEGLARTAWTQNANHLRPDLVTAAPANRLDSSLVGGPFDQTTRLADLRLPDGQVGWYHPVHETLAVYRQRADGYRQATARKTEQPWRFRLDPLGLDRPLFTRGTRAAEVPAAFAPAAVPDTLPAALFEADLAAHETAALLPNGSRPPYTVLYAEVDEEAGAPAACLGIWTDETFITPAVDESAPPATYAAQVVSRRLDPWPAAQPGGGVVAVDVRNGRVAVGTALPIPAALTASFFFGVAGLVGGGDYDRSGWLVATAPQQLITVGGNGADYTSVTAAVNDWTTSGAAHAIIKVLDSGRYAAPASIDVTGRELVIEAANTQRPVLAPGSSGGELAVTGAGSLTLSGFAVEGRLTVRDSLEQLRLFHCTVLPGGPRAPDGTLAAPGPSVAIKAPAASARVAMAFCVLGTVSFQAPIDELLILDSIVVAAAGTDAIAASDPAGLSSLVTERTTFLGDVSARDVTASECLFADRVYAARTQQGCMRYSYVPPGDPAGDSQTPRRYACQPDTAIAAALAAQPGADSAAQAAIADAVRQRVRPVFVSRAYGDPGFGQLDPACCAEIATGAEDGSEMGVYSHVKQAQRLDNITRRVAEYLPAGVTAGITMIT